MILDEVQRFSGASQADDLTLVIARPNEIRGSGAF